MEPTQRCVVCGREGKDLGIWFVNNGGWPVHVDCWITAYDAGRLPIERRTA